MWQASTSIECAMDDGRPLEKLSELIDRRVAVMHETSKNAIVATAITVMRSLRAATRVATGKKKTKADVVDTGLYGSWSHSGNRRCIRQGVGSHSPKVALDGRVVWMVTGVRQERRHVFKVTPEHENVAPYYVVAETETLARNHEAQEMRRRVAHHGGLAGNALSVAMHKTSVKGASPLVGETTSKEKASALVRVQFFTNGELETWKMEDEVAYSVDALKGGQSAIATAMMKAANKVSGQIAQYAKKHFVDGDFSTPFPEVKRRR